MALFSKRLGFSKPQEIMQIECANEELRTSIYNTLRAILGDYSRGSTAEEICKELWTMKWHKPADTFPLYSYEFYPKLYDRILDGEWFVCYDLIEYVYSELEDNGVFDPQPPNFGYGGCGWDSCDHRQEFHDALNAILKEEGSGYRFINGQITPITNELEISSIEQSLSSQNSFTGASAHIEKALELLSKKPDPDYLNSVKESILAAESAAKKSAPGKNNTLADAVDSLRISKGLHKSLSGSWKKMFGYTSDADGIRHAGSGEPVEIDFAFAKYILVTCSAFVNYLAEEFGEDE